MRKIYLAIAALVCGTTSMAQNLDFEAGWTAFPVSSVAGYEYPDDWFATSLREQPGANTTGNAMKLETEDDATLAATLAQAFSINFTNTNVSGFAQYSQGIGGTAFPTSVDYYYQFSPVGNDTAAIVFVEVYDTLSAGNTDDVLLAQGIALYSNAQATWAMGSVPLTVFATGNHNLISISAYSSPKDFITLGGGAQLPDPEDGTTFLIDEIVLTGNMASTIENTKAYAVNAYPNPASDVLRIELPDSKTKTISVISLTGQVLKTIAVNNLNVTMNVSDLENGIYMYQMKDDNGKVLTTKKLVVRK